METIKVASRSRTYFQWVAAMALALCLGIVLALRSTSSGRSFILMGIAQVVPFSICQWLLLRRYGKGNLLWIVVSIIASLVYTIPMSYFSSQLRMNVPIFFRIGLPVFGGFAFLCGTAFGLVLGVFQWAILRRYTANAARWILITMFAFGAGIALNDEISLIFQLANRFDSTIPPATEYWIVYWVQIILSHGIGVLVISAFLTWTLLKLVQPRSD